MGFFGFGGTEVTGAGNSFTTPIVADADTVAAWPHNGDLLDVGVNSFDLSISSGNPVWGGGLAAGLCRQPASNFVQRATNDALLTITGELTLSFSIFCPSTFANTIIHFGNVGETLATNTLYGVRTNSDGSIEWQQENGAGLDGGAAFNALYLVRIHEWFQLHFTRPPAATSVKMYINGVFADEVTGLTAPAGGTTSAMVIGASQAGSVAPYYWQNVYVRDRVLSAEEVLADSRAHFRR